jgi:hypothetical protein
MRTVADLVGKAMGEDVFVCGSGTSLRNFDWSRLEGSTTIALNGAIAAEGFDPTFHLWGDFKAAFNWPVEAHNTTCVCPVDAAAMMRESPSRYKETFFFSMSADSQKNNTRVINFVRSSKCDPRWPSPYGYIKFPEHLVSLRGDDFYYFNTIATGGIHLAAKLGARRIFLLGLDAYSLRAPSGDQSLSSSYYDGTHSAVDERNPVDIGGGRIRAGSHIWWDMEQTKAREYFAKTGRYQGQFPDGGIYNLSKHSTLTAWQKIDQEVALADALRPELVGAGR